MPPIVLPAPHTRDQSLRAGLPLYTFKMGDRQDHPNEGNETIVDSILGSLPPLPYRDADLVELDNSPEESSRGPQVDEEVTKNLNSKIRNLGHQVSATKKVFDAVTALIPELGGETMSRENIRQSWVGIRRVGDP